MYPGVGQEMPVALLWHVDQGKSQPSVSCIAAGYGGCYPCGPIWLSSGPIDEAGFGIVPLLSGLPVAAVWQCGKVGLLYQCSWVLITAAASLVWCLQLV